MEYTTNKKLVMPEYGRNIQQMIDHALTIADREERTRCVNTIVNIMGNLFPYLRDINDFKHKLWDHVAVMSDFKLDIDYPYEIVKPENLHTKPEGIPYKNSRIRYMHYGRTLEEMIEKVGEYEDGEERTELIRLIANQMKKCFLTWNKEGVDDRKIFDDLHELSKGRINISEDFLKLVESKDVLSSKKPKKEPSKKGYKQK
ncbi:DUF4290 domain-containing protein [Paludibacter sp. 221]|uniref:DUF4290 domain-containing protein n=1 Tax=Paludibacter sp. 221 TaxID=2302939 RepID=UPI0013D688DA|nr:DUF4290 domain-containing protein [Paludibacter sp. 221]NDV47014.1 DUF4290 domain-containing protein [Paludibacter sp. 221]